MKKNLKEYVIVFIVIIGIIFLIPGLRFSLLSLFEGDIKVENNNYQYKISYYEDNYTYDILRYNSYIKVLKKEQQWICVTDPCPPTIVKWYRISIDKDSKNILKGLSERYENKTIYSKNLSINEKNIINKVLEKAKE